MAGFRPIDGLEFGYVAVERNPVLVEVVEEPIRVWFARCGAVGIEASETCERRDVGAAIHVARDVADLLAGRVYPRPLHCRDVSTGLRREQIRVHRLTADARSRNGDVA